MKNKPLSENTKQELFKYSELNIIDITKSVSEARNYLTKIEQIKIKIPSINKSLENLERILDFRLLIGILILDLTSATRMQLNSKYEYESLFSVRQIIVIINEGYKKIYNFKITYPNGDEIMRHRNDSFWVKDIGGIIENELPELKISYVELTNELENYFNNYFDEIKEQRDLSIHYDRNPLKVYDMLIKLNPDTTFKKMIPFLSILHNMFNFTHKILIYYNKKENRKTEKLIDNLNNIISVRTNKNTN